jgi:glycosyltransferase involved in cell wall biosynthesis
VTVLIPTFNRADLLPRTLESVLAQDHEQLDVLVLDDGSTDGTPERLRDYAARAGGRLRWDRHENMGQVRTLNRGFDMITAELVCLISSDDLMAPDAVSTLADALTKVDGAVVAYSDYHWIDDDDQPEVLVNTLDFDSVTALRMQDCAIGPGALVRRSAIDEVGGWNPEYRYCPDLEFWIRLGLVGKFVHVRRALTGLRRHEGALSSHRNLRMADERIMLVRRLYARDDLPQEVLEIRDEAFRAAFVQAGMVVAGPPTYADERFVVGDRLGHVTLPNSSYDPAVALVQKELELKRALEALEEAHESLRWLHREVALRDAELAELRTTA